MRIVIFMIVMLVGVVAWAVPVGAGPLDMPGAVKAMNCAACHGPAGQSPSENMPILAGMWPEYFKKAIEDYAAGRRPSPEMEPYAKQVVQLGLADIGAYFAAQKRTPPVTKVDAAAVARGRAAAKVCAACHGADGRGERDKLIPDISGQPAGYLNNQLLLFKQDRRSPADEKLKAAKAVIKDIPESTLADLAAYFSSLR